MERRVTVNDPDDASLREALDGQTPSGGAEELDAGVESDAELEFFESPNANAPQGPCLYLGRSGERCSRAAIEGGYCAKHHPDTDKRWPNRSYTRVLVASAALAMILWPYVADAIRLLIHLVHSFATD